VKGHVFPHSHQLSILTNIWIFANLTVKRQYLSVVLIASLLIKASCRLFIHFKTTCFLLIVNFLHVSDRAVVFSCLYIDKHLYKRDINALLKMLAANVSSSVFNWLACFRHAELSLFFFMLSNISIFFLNAPGY